MSRRPEGGPSMAAIAAELERAAERYPDCPDMGGRLHWSCGNPETVARVGGLTVRCLPYRNHVLAVAAKYRKGLARSAAGRQLFKPPRRRSIPPWTAADEAAFQKCFGYPTTYEEKTVDDEDDFEDYDMGPEWDFTDEDGETHNVGEYV